MKRRPVTRIVDGEWVVISWLGQREQCCDCGLVHDVDYKVENGKLHFRAVRKDKETSRGRKRN